MHSGVIFPNEILLLIKEFIPQSDLRTHVCFYNTCRTTATFYGDNSQQADFWRRACLLSGIGWIKGDSSWKEIAFETIAKDGFCTHPDCGGRLLDWNAKQVANAVRRYNWDLENGPWDADLDTESVWHEVDALGPICSPIFKHICFGQEPMPLWYTDLRDIHLRNDEAVSWTHRQTPAADHPVAMRSFACFPALTTMPLDFVEDDHPAPINYEGVTVWDVVRCVHSSLDHELPISFMLRLLNGPFSAIFPNSNRYSSDFVTDLMRFSTGRGLWFITRCKGIVFSRGDEDSLVFTAGFCLSPEESARRHITGST